MAHVMRVVDGTEEKSTAVVVPQRHQSARKRSSSKALSNTVVLSLTFHFLVAIMGQGGGVRAFSSSSTPIITPSFLAQSQASNKRSFRAPGALRLSPPIFPGRFDDKASTGRKSPRFITTPRRSPVTSLATTSEPLEEDDDDGNDNNDEAAADNKGNIFRTAAAKFKARPGTYLLIPVIAGFVGWLTNYLAVQMIFYPVKFRGIDLWRKPEVPLGLLGWQGIVPCKTKTMSKALVEMVTTQLLTVPEAFERMDPRIVAKHLAGAVPQLGEEVIKDVVVTTTTAKTTPFPLGLWKTVFGGGGWFSGIVDFCNVRVLTGVVRDLIKNSERIFSLENCVVNQMVLDRAKLGQLFRKVGSAELDFLTNSGLWFGFLLGLIQMAVALCWENPWALSIGGMVVGLATNWLALKWIFEPVYPTKVGPFVIQGMFLKRQKEVAAEFSKFFANKIVTSEQIWNSILTDEATKPALAEVLGRHLKRLLNIATFGGLFSRLGGFSAPSPALVGRVTGSAVANLPRHLTRGLHRYVDGALQLETTLRVQMEAMSPAKFERVLHPIFEEDELTLIIAGGVLGFIAGLIQQGLETGAIKFPTLMAPIKKLATKVNSKSRAALGNIKGRFAGKKNNTDIDPENGDGVRGEEGAR